MKSLDQLRESPNLRHLKRLTTPVGLIQHADHEVPDPSFGYSIDDNARALTACLWHYQTFQDDSVLHLAEIYFNYIKKAEKDGGSFHNFFSFTEKNLDSEGSEDSIGRAIWALGETIKLHPDKNVKEQAKEMLKRADLSRHLEHPHLRTKAYILLGLVAAGEKRATKIWADMLMDRFKEKGDQKNNWLWFEDSLRYANAILPYALAAAFDLIGEKAYLEAANVSFNWLNKVSRINNKPAPIGQNGWYYKGQEKSEYDQQPLEAADMVLAASKLYESNHQAEHLKSALDWINWYYGNNCQGLVMINPETGGVYDALTPGGVNLNQGAESIVTYLLAYLSLGKLAE